MKLRKRFEDYTELREVFSRHVYIREKLQDFEDAVKTEKTTFAALSLGLVVEYMTLQYAAHYAKYLADSRKTPQKKRLDKLLEKKILTGNQHTLFLSIAHIRNQYGGHVYLEQLKSDGEDDSAESEVYQEKQEMFDLLISKYEVLLNEEFRIFFKKCPDCKPFNNEKQGDWIFEDLSGPEIFELGLEFENTYRDNKMNNWYRNKKEQKTENGKRLHDTNYIMAVKSYEKAAEKKYLPALYELIEFYSDQNRGNKKYMVKKYLEKLEQYTDPYTMLYLGYIYSDGLTVEKDIPKAKTYFEKAGELGLETAYMELGILYQYEESQIPNISRARSCYEHGLRIAGEKNRNTEVWEETLKNL